MGPPVEEGVACFVYCVASRDAELVKVGSSIHPEKRAPEWVEELGKWWGKNFEVLGWIPGSLELEVEIQDKIGGHPLPTISGNSPENFPWSRHLVGVLASYGFKLPEWFVEGPEKTTLEILAWVDKSLLSRFGEDRILTWTLRPELVKPEFPEPGRAPVPVVKGEVPEKGTSRGRQKVVQDEQRRGKKAFGQSDGVVDVRGSVSDRVVDGGVVPLPKDAVIAGLGEEVPEKIDWLEEESDGVKEEQAALQASEAEQEAGGPGADSGGADPIQGSEPGILPLSGRNPGGASAAPPVRGRAPGVVERSPVVTPVYESFAAQVKRYAQRIKDEYPETDPGRADEQAAMLVKNERRQKALEAEGAGREAAPDYDTGSQEVRRGRRKR